MKAILHRRPPPGATPPGRRPFHFPFSPGSFYLCISTHEQQTLSGADSLRVLMHFRCLFELFRCRSRKRKNFPSLPPRRRPATRREPETRELDSFVGCFCTAKENNRLVWGTGISRSDFRDRNGERVWGNGTLV